MEDENIKEAQRPDTRLSRYTWFKSMNGQRIFVIVGHWYTGDPEKEEVELLELYRKTPIIHPRKKLEELILDGELIPY